MHDYPNSPAWGKTDTSYEAAESMVPVTAGIQRAVLAWVRARGERGATAVEIAEGLGMERTTVQPRTTELRRLYLLDDSGHRRPNPNGKRAIVWVATGVGA